MKIRWVRENPDRARAMGRAGRRRVLDESSVEKMVDGTVRMCEKVLAEAAAG